MQGLRKEDSPEVAFAIEGLLELTKISLRIRVYKMRAGSKHKKMQVANAAKSITEDQRRGETISIRNRAEVAKRDLRNFKGDGDYLMRILSDDYLMD